MTAGALRRVVAVAIKSGLKCIVMRPEAGVKRTRDETQVDGKISHQIRWLAL